MIDIKYDNNDVKLTIRTTTGSDCVIIIHGDEDRLEFFTGTAYIIVSRESIEQFLKFFKEMIELKIKVLYDEKLSVSFSLDHLILNVVNVPDLPLLILSVRSEDDYEINAIMSMTITNKDVDSIFNMENYDLIRTNVNKYLNR